MRSQFSQQRYDGTDLVELREMVSEPLDLQNKGVILIPINNNSNVTSVGGSHWSLLVFEKKLDGSPVFRHYDSFGGSNNSIAKKTAKKFAAMLRIPLDVENSKHFVSDAFGGKRQTNSYDCGVYLLAFAEKILKRIRSDDETTISAINDVRPEDAKQMRGDLLQLIERLSNDPKHKPKSSR